MSGIVRCPEILAFTLQLIMSGKVDPLFFSKESGHDSSSSSGGGGAIKENYSYPYCPEVSKYTQLAMVGQGTFG